MCLPLWVFKENLLCFLWSWVQTWIIQHFELTFTTDWAANAGHPKLCADLVFAHILHVNYKQLIFFMFYLCVLHFLQCFSAKIQWALFLECLHSFPIYQYLKHIQCIFVSFLLHTKLRNAQCKYCIFYIQSHIPIFQELHVPCT